MLIFLDTEFTDFTESECDLISIGLVDENGRDFYAELTDYRDEACSDFVRQVVKPLLKKYPSRIEGSRWQVARQLSEWLQPYRDDCTICFDYNTDWTLMRDMLLLLPDEELPDFLTAKNIWGNLYKESLDAFWLVNDLPQHMALYDAYANRFAYIPLAKERQNGNQS